MRFLNHFGKSIFLVSCAFLVIACSNPQKYPPPSSTITEIEDKSARIEVDVFYDATLSMQGFVNPSITTTYAQVLDRIEGSITTGWQNVTISFYKFGTRIRRLNEREHLHAISPSFYNDTELSSITSLENVINAVDPEHLCVIVTDLFQNDADVTLLTNAIRNRFLIRNLSVGLVGIKSDFAGTVFDIGINRYRFAYKGQRPFYILIIGKHRDIEHLYRSLDSRILRELTDKEFLIFSRHFSSPLPSFENAKVLLKKNIDEITNILPHNSKDSRVKQLRIKSGSPQSQLTIRLAKFPLPFTLSLDSSALKVELTAYKVENIGGKDTLILYKEGNNALTTDPWVSDSLIELRLSIDHGKLTTTGIYIFEQRIHLKDNMDLLPYWISSWNMDLTNLPGWRQNPSSFKGNTTLNLRNFTFDLFQALNQTQKPNISHLFYYIRKE